MLNPIERLAQAYEDLEGDTDYRPNLSRLDEEDVGYRPSDMIEREGMPTSVVAHVIEPREALKSELEDDVLEEEGRKAVARNMDAEENAILYALQQRGADYDIGARVDEIEQWDPAEDVITAYMHPEDATEENLRKEVYGMNTAEILREVDESLQAELEEEGSVQDKLREYMNIS